MWFPENETNLCSSSHFPLRSSCRHLEGNLRQVTSEFSPSGSDMATMLEGGTSVKAQDNGVPESLSGLTMLRLGCALYSSVFYNRTSLWGYLTKKTKKPEHAGKRYSDPVLVGCEVLQHGGQYGDSLRISK